MPDFSTVTVTEAAQTVSRALDEAQEDVGGLTGGLFVDPYEQSADERRVTEISAELTNSSNGLASHFSVTFSTGQRFRISVTPEPA